MKIPYIFGKWNFLALILGNFSYFLKGKLLLYFLKRKLFSYFRKRKHWKNSLYFLKEICCYFRKTEALKNSLYFRKRNFLIFQERYIQNPGITKFFYISGKVYSGHWYNWTFVCYEKSIFRTLTYSEQEVYSESWYI